MNRFESAKAICAAMGANIEATLEKTKGKAVSNHRWHGDGIQPAGNYPFRVHV